MRTEQDNRLNKRLNSLLHKKALKRGSPHYPGSGGEVEVDFENTDNTTSPCSCNFI